MWYNANLFFCLRSFHSFVLSFHLRTREMLKWWLFSNEYVFLFRTQKCMNLMVWGRIQRWKYNGNEQNYIAKKYCIEGKKMNENERKFDKWVFFFVFSSSWAFVYRVLLWDHRFGAWIHIYVYVYVLYT